MAIFGAKGFRQAQSLRFQPTSIDDGNRNALTSRFPQIRDFGMQITFNSAVWLKNYGLRAACFQCDRTL